MHKRYRKYAAAAALTLSIVVAGVAGAQSNRVTPSQEPTARIDSAARGIKDLNLPRNGSQDSTLAGGGGSVLPDNRVTLPSQCEIDPFAQGCPRFCEANPTSLVCGGEGVVLPPVVQPDPDPGQPAMIFACSCPGMAYMPNGGWVPAVFGENFASLRECEARLSASNFASTHYCDSTQPFHMGPMAVCFSIVRRGLIQPIQEHCSMT